MNIYRLSEGWYSSSSVKEILSPPSVRSGRVADGFLIFLPGYRQHQLGRQENLLERTWAVVQSHGHHMFTFLKIFSVLILSADILLAQPKIGVIAPLTGPAASSGRWILQGVRLAEDELSRSGCTKPMVQVEDDSCSAQGGVSAYQALRRLGISLIVGPVCNAAAVPLIGLADREDVTLIATGLPSGALLDAGSSLFTILPPIQDVAQAIVKFAADKGYAKFAVLYTPDEFGEENFAAFSKAARQHGRTIIYSEQFVPGSSDFRNFLLRARRGQADSFLAAAYVGHYLTFLRQAGESDSRLPLFAVPTLQSPEIAALPPASFNIFYSYPSGALSGAIESLKRTYFKDHPEEGDMMAMHVGAGRDGLLLASQAANSCPHMQTQCIRDALIRTHRFDGMNGVFSIDKNGNRSHHQSLEIRQLSEGKYRVVESTRLLN